MIAPHLIESKPVLALTGAGASMPWAQGVGRSNCADADKFRRSGSSTRYISPRGAFQNQLLVAGLSGARKSGVFYEKMRGSGGGVLAHLASRPGRLLPDKATS